MAPPLADLIQIAGGAGGVLGAAAGALRSRAGARRTSEDIAVGAALGGVAGTYLAFLVWLVQVLPGE